MRTIVKTFGGVHALRGVDLVLARGSVHALVGENGAGKSTLIRVMTGATAPTSGTIEVEGQAVTFRSPQEAQAHGVVAVYQEVNVLAHRTVAENLFLGREPRRFGLVDFERMHADAGELLAGLGLGSLDPRATLGLMPIALRQMVAIARGVSLGGRVLVLDEPTSSLTSREIDLLYDLIARVKQRGTAIVYISHRLDEIYTVCDTVTVLRDGTRVASSPLAGLYRLELVAQMLGRPSEALQRKRPAPSAPPEARAPHETPLLRARRLRHQPGLRDVSVDAYAGEIVGLAGLLGSGRTETARVIFGADRLSGGTVEVDGTPLVHHTPRHAVAAGVGFVAEDRGAEGIVPELSVRENMTLAVLPTLARFGFVSRSRENRLVDDLVRRLRIKTNTPEQPIRNLSGGNQQKVLLARWLCREPRLLLVDEPTRGIDIGAKAEIHALLDELAARGVAVVLISSELDELASASTRIVVLRDGVSVAELTGDAVDVSAIVHAIAGDVAPPRAAEAP